MNGYYSTPSLFSTGPVQCYSTPFIDPLANAIIRIVSDRVISSSTDPIVIHDGAGTMYGASFIDPLANAIIRIVSERVISSSTVPVVIPDWAGKMYSTPLSTCSPKQ